LKYCGDFYIEKKKSICDVNTQRHRIIPYIRDYITDSYLRPQEIARITTVSAKIKGIQRLLFCDIPYYCRSCFAPSPSVIRPLMRYANFGYDVSYEYSWRQVPKMWPQLLEFELQFEKKKPVTLAFG
jgi:hypothetical protein